MSKQIIQLIYPGQDPSFKGLVYQLGIQGIPGTQFNLIGENKNILGLTGIFDFDFGDEPQSINLNFNDLNLYNNNQKLIIDIIYESEGGSEQ